MFRKISFYTTSLLFVLLCFASSSFGQQTFQVGNKTALYVSLGGSTADSAQRLPWRRSAFQYFDSTGRIYYNRYGDSAVYFHNGLSWKKLLADGSVVPVDSRVYSTVFRNDTGNRNIRAQIAALPTSDSSAFSTIFRNDTGNANIRAQIAALPPVDSGLFSTVYRNDTGNSNIRAEIAALPPPDSSLFSTVYRNDTGNENIRAEIAALPTADSLVFSSVYRNDTGNTNIRAQIAALPPTDSALFSTVYRNDTGNRNIRAQIAALPPTDSAVFQTTYRSDTGRRNIYGYVITNQALDVKYTDTAAMLAAYLRKADSIATYFTKYRSDTMRTNLYNYINTKGIGTVTNVTASAPIVSSGGATPNITALNASEPIAVYLVKYGPTAGIQANNFNSSAVAITTPTATVQYTVDSPRRHFYTGSSGVTIRMPNTTTLRYGTIYEVYFSGAASDIAYQTSAGNSIITLSPSQGTASCSFECKDTTSNVAASWFFKQTYYGIGGGGTASPLGTGAGGTGRATFTAGGIPYGGSAAGDALSSTVAGLAGESLQGQGTSQAPIWLKNPRRNVFNLTDAATIAWDMSQGADFAVRLGGNRAMGVPTSVLQGSWGGLTFTQDATGSRLLPTFPYPYIVRGPITLTTAADSSDYLQYFVQRYGTSTVTISLAAPALVTWNSNATVEGQTIQFTTTGSLPTGLAINTTYYIHVVNSNTFNISSSLANLAAGTYISTAAGSQSGTHTALAATILIAPYPSGATGSPGSGTVTSVTSADGNITVANTTTTPQLTLVASPLVAVSSVTTNANFYPAFVTAGGGNQAITTATTQLTYNPSTGALTTPSFVGTLNGNASTATLASTVTTNANLAGDVTSVGNTTTLATVNSNVGNFGSATQTPTITVNGKGLTTAIGNVTITPAIGSVTGLGTGVATFLVTPSSANLASAVTGETGSGGLVFNDKPTFLGTVQTVTAMAAQAVDGSLGNMFTRTLAGSEVFTQSNMSTGQNFIVRVRQGAGTTYTVTWFATVTWITSGGTAPVQTTTTNGYTTYAFTCTGANTFDGYLIGSQ